METTVQISEVESRSVNTSRGPSVVYNIKGGDGRSYSTFKADLGQKAAALRGQAATLGYTEKQNGKYTNYYLDSVEPAGDTFVAPAANGATSNHVSAKPSDDRAEQINRSVAFKAAVDLTSSGFFQVENIGDLDKLTKQLIPIVDGSYASNGKATAEPVTIADESLIDF